MSGDDENEQEQEVLVCVCDNVAVSPEDPRCQHPSSQCAYRELCPVRDAIRQNDVARAANPGTADPDVVHRSSSCSLIYSDRRASIGSSAAARSAG
jgi:hypothetical protein